MSINISKFSKIESKQHLEYFFPKLTESDKKTFNKALKIFENHEDNTLSIIGNSVLGTVSIIYERESGESLVLIQEKYDSKTITNYDALKEELENFARFIEMNVFEKDINIDDAYNKILESEEYNRLCSFDESFKDIDFTNPNTYRLKLDMPFISTSSLFADLDNAQSMNMNELKETLTEIVNRHENAKKVIAFAEQLDNGNIQINNENEEIIDVEIEEPKQTYTNNRGL